MLTYFAFGLCIVPTQRFTALIWFAFIMGIAGFGYLLVWIFKGSKKLKYSKNKNLLTKVVRYLLLLTFILAVMTLLTSSDSKTTEKYMCANAIVNPISESFQLASKVSLIIYLAFVAMYYPLLRYEKKIKSFTEQSVVIRILTYILIGLIIYCLAFIFSEQLF